jgi:kumamolisin
VRQAATATVATAQRTGISKKIWGDLMQSRIGIPALIAGAMLAATAGVANAAQPTASNFSAIPQSLASTTDTDVGSFTSSSMTVTVVLAPSNQTQLSNLLSSAYNPQSPGYQQWLSTGQFDAQFAPSANTVSAVTNYLQSNGLTVSKTASPFMIRATGPSSAVSGVFQTTLRNYVNRQGLSYHSNGTAVQLPNSIAANVLGVVGLSNSVRPHSQIMFDYHHQRQPIPSCEAPYPTVAQLFNAVNNGVSFPFGYGGGPGCQGLTPSQLNSLYNAPSFGASGQGRGVNLAVFELSAYQHSDILTWAHQFYGSRYSPPLVDITVDGGPLNAICPSGDECPPAFEFYAGDIEVDADIEMQLAIAPAAQRILVYNAPNDFTGQTELDEYTQIANDNIADVVSSSWGLCENDAGAAYVQAENLIFIQMALQGQSVFGAAGDTGAFDCIRSDGTTIVNVGDPPSQPWVTSVGGTSFYTFNPNANPNPDYPYGVETVWNVDNICNASNSEGGQPGFFWCAELGAGGGGYSQFWGQPFYQFGPGVISSRTAYGNGTTQCSLARKGTPCREVPDVSANADPYTPYAEYCTGSAATLNSVCATITGPPAGWFGIGGTSLSSPVWSAIIADRDGFRRARSGNVNPLLYRLFNSGGGYFHDISGLHQSTNNNGLFPVTPGYDMATGIGTPNMEAIITGFPQW